MFCTAGMLWAAENTIRKLAGGSQWWQCSPYDQVKPDKCNCTTGCGSGWSVRPDTPNTTTRVDIGTLLGWPIVFLHTQIYSQTGIEMLSFRLF